ncbi:hypothetical protein ACFQ60_25205 [Streptomyces zhihengii]
MEKITERIEADRLHIEIGRTYPSPRPPRPTAPSSAGAPPARSSSPLTTLPAEAPAPRAGR